MQNRKKAQDIFNDTESVFGKKVTADEAFPEAKTIKVEVIEWRGISERDERPRILHKANISEYFNCSNSICYAGGFQLANVIRSMIDKRQTELSGDSACQGYEGSAKGGKRYRSCLHNFEYKVQIEYNEGS